MKIPVDKSRIPKGVSVFDKIREIEVEKEDLFKLGIFKEEIPPSHVHETEYLYLQSKVSAYMELYNDFIEVKGNTIVNLSRDDRKMKDVSEIVGIALGIKFTIECFAVKQQEITKIPPPDKKAKYLDYKFTSDEETFEIETKGTTSANVKSFVADILKKKKASESTSFRFGTVAVLAKPGKSHKSILHICDDPPEDVRRKARDTNIPWHYISAFGYLLDNKYYNEIARAVQQGRKPKIKRARKIKEGFFGSYVYRGKTYFGEYFDFRVNLENVASQSAGRGETLNAVFRRLTREKGRKKFFIGVRSDIVELVLGGGGLEEILRLDIKRIKSTDDAGVEILRDSDGIIVVSASDRVDPQIEEIFTEQEVKNRIGNMLSFQRNEPTLCGAPCRSREKKGKACAIKTFRGSCHFHR